MPTKPEFDALEALQACEKPFLFEEHSFIMKESRDDDGKSVQQIDSVYILKDALRRRLTLIDRLWQTLPAELMGVQGNVITMRGTMLFLGTTRSAVGTGIIQATKTDYKTKAKVAIEGYELDRQIAKSMKTAVSDLLPRLCLEWNIGSYLRPLPKTIKTEAQFRTWLDGKVKAWDQLYANQRHWAANGKGLLFNNLIKAYGLTWHVVSQRLEPGRALIGMRDISLTDVEAFQRLAEIKAELKPVGGV